MALSFLYGVIGGGLGELLKWYSLRESPNLPTYIRSPFYWIVTGIMILAGGGLVLIQGVQPNNPWLAINVGITAPLILKGFASLVPIQPTAPTIPPAIPAQPAGAPVPPQDLAQPAAPVPVGFPDAVHHKKPSLINFLAGR
jgi:hypothetical protein